MPQTPDDITEINDRIKKLKKTEPKASAPLSERKFVYAYQVGTRIAAELVSGVLVGAGLGYLADKIFDCAPFCLIGLLILGGAAGFLNVYRFVKQEDRKDK